MTAAGTVARGLISATAVVAADPAGRLPSRSDASSFPSSLP
jgi:hypothetical protein